MVNRIQPQGPPQAYKTFQISAPEATHYRKASCEEIACQMNAYGWQTVIDETTELGGQQAHYIRNVAGRAYTELRENGTTVFMFPAGETCFTNHQLPLEREAFYVVRGGDWRGNPRREVYVHDNPDSWVNDFAEHQDRLNKTLNG